MENTTCPKCQGYTTMPYTWSGTNLPRMCTCPKPESLLGTLAWECHRCRKINAPWKSSCDCTPPPLSGAPTCGTSPYTAGKNNFNQTYTQ